MTYVIKAPSGSSEVIIDEKVLGKGGEGSVHLVKEHKVSGLPKADDLVAKFYHDPQQDNRRDKVIAMINNPPDDIHSFAWPLGVVFKDKKFVGYVMSKIDSSVYRNWSDLANSRDRKKNAPDFDFKYAITSCLNFSIALSSINSTGNMLGDINESNVAVKTDSSIMIMDTDSAQITYKDKFFPCTVGKPEYTAPELSHGSLRDQKRTLQSEVYAFAVICFQMLTGGSHPSDGTYSGNGEPLSQIEKMRLGIYPALGKSIDKQYSPPPRVNVEALPLQIREELSKSLKINPRERISVDNLTHAFKSVLENLIQCKKQNNHWFDKRDHKKCPWCGTHFDAWGTEEAHPKKAKQHTLPELSFNKKDDGPVIRRAPASSSVALPSRPRNSPNMAPHRAQPQQMQHRHQYAQQAAQNVSQLRSNHNGKMFLSHNPITAFSMLTYRGPDVFHNKWSNKKFRPTFKHDFKKSGWIPAFLVCAVWVFLAQYQYFDVHWLNLSVNIFFGLAALSSIGSVLSLLFTARKSLDPPGAVEFYNEGTPDFKLLSVSFVYGPIAIIYYVSTIPLYIISNIVELVKKK